MFSHRRLIPCTRIYDSGFALDHSEGYTVGYKQQHERASIHNFGIKEGLYILTIKKITYEEGFAIMMSWSMESCDSDSEDIIPWISCSLKNVEVRSHSIILSVLRMKRNWIIKRIPIYLFASVILVHSNCLPSFTRQDFWSWLYIPHRANYYS